MKHSKRMSGLSFTAIVMIVCVFALLGALLVGQSSGCTRPAEATRVLQNSGFTNIRITGYRFFMGGKGDVFVTGFEANGANGQSVSGAVCSGWFKGSTIRFD